jgi:hypothetical protein
MRPRFIYLRNMNSLLTKIFAGRLRLAGRVRPLSALAAIVPVAGCAFGSGSEHLDRAIDQQTVRHACSPSRVHYQRHPQARPDGLLPATPWIRADPATKRVDGFLFYYGGSRFEKARDLRATIYTRGKSPGGGATKILWVLPNGGRVLAIVGERVGDGRRFVEHIDAIGSGWFPSGIVVPASGCWRLTLTSGHITASVTFLAISA